ncbi:UNVERIFIED_CONTAM: DNA/RNA non-specific endonuclease [Acetivibrio alkalicellulosi]
MSKSLVGADKVGGDLSNKDRVEMLKSIEKQVVCGILSKEEGTKLFEKIIAEHSNKQENKDYIMKRPARLKPNIEYTANGYNYKTDDKGRIKSVEGQLVLEEAKRNKYHQRIVGGEDRLETDEGGHLIASIFKGSGDIDNLVPMDANLNKGEWKKIENDWAEALKEEPPKEVKVNITPIYEGDSQRPTKFEIEYQIGKSRPEIRELKNKPGGK